MAGSYRWACPDGGPAKADDLAQWAVANLGDVPAILCNERDLAALRGTLLAERVSLVEPRQGIVQPGTVWIDVEAAR